MTLIVKPYAKNSANDYRRHREPIGRFAVYRVAGTARPPFDKCEDQA